MPPAPGPPPQPPPPSRASTTPLQSRGGYAPWHAIPPRKIISIEHPAIIKNVDKAIETLGGAKALKKLSETSASSGLDLRFRPEDIMQPPIQSKTVGANNILLKIRIPKRKRTSGEGPDERSVLEKLCDAGGEYTVEAVGVIARTVRFRDMANYQFNTADMEIVQRVRVELGGLEYEKIKNFEIPPSRGLSDPHPILPPPAFSNTTMQHNYHYRQNPAIKKTLVAGKPALLNLQAAPKTLTPMVHISAPTIPLHPPDSLRPYDLLDRGNKQCVDRLRKLFAQRPIWTRRALFNHFPKNLQSLVRFSMVHVAYMWRAGPWRDTCVVYGLDPRVDSQYRVYQAVFFQVDTEKTATGREKARTGASHIFDGKNLVRDGRCFQLCDVTDPLLKSVIDGARVRSKCDYVDGWYHSTTMNKIKTIMRLKIRALADGHIPTDADHVDVLEQESEDEDQEAARKLREQEERQERRKRRLEKRVRPARPVMTIAEEEEEGEEPEEEEDEEEEDEGGGGGEEEEEEEDGGGEWGQELNLMSGVEGVIDPMLLNEGRPGVAPMATVLDGRVWGAMGELLRQEEESSSGGNKAF